MTRCPEFYSKLLKDGNFCGLSDGAISQIKGYLETVDKIASRGVPKEEVMERFPEGAARPLLSLKDDETRTTALNYVVGRLKEGEKITAGDLKSSIKVWLGSDKCTVDKHDGNPGHVSKKFTNVNSPTEEKPDAPPQPSLAEQMKTVPHGSSAFHTARQELAAKKAGIAGEMYPANDHIADVSKMAPVLPPKPSEGASYAEKLAYDEALIASHRARPITDEHRPLNIIPVQLTKEQAEAAIASVGRGYFTPKSREQWDSLKRVGRWDTDLEALEGLRDDAAERLP